jgi:uncharacterized protein YhjY with autotransporter beta-barrel domain
VLCAGFCLAPAAFAQTFTLTVQPNTITAGTNGQFYSQVFTGVGGTDPYTFAVTSGTLPLGLSLASDGTLSGTPTTPNSYTFTITATDADGNTGFRPYTFSIGTAGGLSPGIGPPSLPNGTQGTAYSQSLTASGGTVPYTFSLISGSLPPGLSLSGGGTISGTPAAGGSSSFTVGVRDKDGNTGTKAYTLDIGSNILTVTPPTLPNGTQSSPYSQNVNASGGTGPYSFTVSSGSLPAGLSLSGNTISGTPIGLGPSTFTIRAVDSAANFGTQSYTINIGSNILTVSPPTLPNGTVGTGYSQTIMASGGSAPYTFTVASGALPTGLTLSGGGTLGGTPSAAGTYSFTVQASDPSFNTGTQAYTVTVNPAPLAIDPPTLPAATVGTAYNRTLTASGGTAPYSFALLSGSLPPGLSLGGGGGITGTPTVAGAYTFTVQATDATPNTGTRTYTLNVGTNSLTMSPATLPNGTQGSAYNSSVSASGGSGSYTFALTSGALPAGLSLSSGGAITGTPAGSGSSTFTIGVTDSVGDTGSGTYTVNIGTNSLTVTPASMPAGTQNVAYSQTLGATGGTGGPYTFTIAAGSLPAGLSLSGNAISGTPTGSGASGFTVRAVDGLGNAGTHVYAMNIGTVSLTITPATLTPAVAGVTYSQPLTASGGTAPYTFTIASGALPPGLALSSGGVISGTPSGHSTANFTVQALDINGNIGSRAYTLGSRGNPALDPEVQGLVTNQVAAAQRFANAQLDNITHHLESLHDQFLPCSAQFNVMPPIDRGTPYNPANPYAPPPYDPYGATGASGQMPPYGPARDPRTKPGTANCPFDWATPLAAWSSGSFQFGTMQPNGTTTSQHFNTAGVTAGLDARLSDRLIVGAALGFASDRSEIGSNGTRSAATSFSGSLYASLRVLNPLVLDGVVGYGALGYDNRRYVTDDGSIVAGTRRGSYWFGALTASFDMTYGDIKFAPYLRGDFISATLNGYSEQGASAELLTFDQMKFSATAGAVGLRGSIDIPTDFGILAPTLRLEYRETSLSTYSQSMAFSDLPGTDYLFTQPSAAYGTTTGTLGLRLRSLAGLEADVEYGLSYGSDALQMQTWRARLRVPF